MRMVSRNRSRSTGKLVVLWHPKVEYHIIHRSIRCRLTPSHSGLHDRIPTSKIMRSLSCRSVWWQYPTTCSSRLDFVSPCAFAFLKLFHHLSVATTVENPKKRLGTRQQVTRLFFLVFLLNKVKWKHSTMCCSKLLHNWYKLYFSKWKTLTRVNQTTTSIVRLCSHYTATSLLLSKGLLCHLVWLKLGLWRIFAIFAILVKIATLQGSLLVSNLNIFQTHGKFLPDFLFSPNLPFL